MNSSDRHDPMFFLGQLVLLLSADFQGLDDLGTHLPGVDSVVQVLKDSPLQATFITTVE